MEIVVRPHKTLRMNLAICKPFNADEFQGIFSLDYRRLQKEALKGYYLLVQLKLGENPCCGKPLKF